MIKADKMVKFRIGDRVRLNGNTPRWIAQGNHPQGKVVAITHKASRRIYSIRIRDKGKGYPCLVQLRSYQADPLVPLPTGRPAKSALRKYHQKVKRVLRYGLGIKGANRRFSEGENQGFSGFEGYDSKASERACFSLAKSKLAIWKGLSGISW